MAPSNKNNNINFIDFIFIGFAIVISMVLGATYSYHNSDFHHWGFILGTFLDYNDGRKLFTEVYIQYGVGQSIFYSFIDKLISVNYTSIGVITNIVYVASGVLLYLSVKIIASGRTATFATLLYFLIHPFAFYPWPDYYAGFFLALAVYILLRNSQKIEFGSSVAVGVAIFLACIFRTTYFVSVTLSCFCYLMFYSMKRRGNNNKIIFGIVAYFLLCAIYIIHLYLNNDIQLWFSQSLHSSVKTYSIQFKNIAYWILNILSPKDLILFPFTLMAILTALYLARVIRNRGCSEENEESLVFISFLALAGFLQTLRHYEVFRLQTASYSLYIVAAFVIYHSAVFRFIRLGKSVKYLLPIIILLPLLFKLPNQLLGRDGMLFPVVKFESVFPLENYEKIYPEYSRPLILKDHRLDEGTSNYFRELMMLVCPRGKKILNLTGDSIVPYVCDEPRNSSYIPFHSLELLQNISALEVERISSGKFKKDEIIVTQDRLANQDLLLLGTALRPSSYRWFNEATIYVYELK